MHARLLDSSGVTVHELIDASVCKPVNDFDVEYDGHVWCYVGVQYGWTTFKISNCHMHAFTPEEKHNLAEYAESNYPSTERRVIDQSPLEHRFETPYGIPCKGEMMADPVHVKRVEDELQLDSVEREIAAYDLQPIMSTSELRVMLGLKPLPCADERKESRRQQFLAKVRSTRCKCGLCFP